MFEEYLEIINEKSEDLCRLSDAIWENPETAFSEDISSSLLMEFLSGEGFEIQSPVFGIKTAFTASFGSGKPVIGFLGEFDALSGLSQVSGSFEKAPLCEGGNGHGCGHNLLGTGAVAAALAAKNFLEKTKKPGTVIYYGCPGEEGGSGKAFMAREGAFDGLDCALTWHPGELNRVVQNTSLANIQVLYKFTGTSAHAAGNPEDGRSALDALELMNVGVNFLREHMISSARIHYSIVNSGGYSPNVVQPNAEGLYLIRAPRMDQVKGLFERVNKIARGMAMATETSVEYEIIKSCSNLIPNHVLEKELYRSMKDLPLPSYTQKDYEDAEKITATSPLPSGNIINKHFPYVHGKENREFLKSQMEDKIYDFVLPYEEIEEPVVMGGSTDVGDVSWKCPTAQIETATWAPNSGGHSWQIVSQGKGSLAHKGMLHCGKILGLTAIRLFESEDVLKDAKKEYEQTMKGLEYIPIPPEVMPRPMNLIGQKR